ncbi:RNA 2',3'-cyclic phosphodiesterase [Nitrosomonas sp.]|uniref:RNA 2',3'-cyclic phosphodiesterase n=1 Tax=Nitrosomonas sp. TaxID=42353 RepID=UPI001D73F0B0|nr:RNA 2',3'-cyclic phosphodiesterase [Nitrosomonas sp.]MBX3615808.1 RNA 2',3'-cyclic phosphodiesterase [Nitrosomonas sp.]
MVDNNSASEKESSRVFLAAFPNEILQKKLTQQAVELHTTCGGRIIKTRHIHLTLLFLGNVDICRIDILRETMRKISAQKFELELNKISYWKHNQIIFAEAEHYPNELFLLVESLRNSLTEAGFLFDKRHYKPHITLIKKASHPITSQLMKPILWHINEWHLVQSKPGQKGIDYISLAHWPLK